MTPLTIKFLVAEQTAYDANSSQIAEQPPIQILARACDYLLDHHSWVHVVLDDAASGDQCHRALWEQPSYWLPTARFPLDDNVSMADSTFVVFVHSTWPTQPSHHAESYNDDHAFVNMTSTVVPWRNLSSGITKLYELVWPDPNQKSQQRQRFRQYREANLSPSTLNL